MTKLEFYVGAGMDRNGQDVQGIQDKTERACQLLAEQYGGYTMLNALGGWHDDKGRLVQEKSAVFQVFVDESEVARQSRAICPNPSAEIYSHGRVVARTLRDLFNQSSVLFSATKVDAEFI